MNEDRPPRIDRYDHTDPRIYDSRVEARLQRPQDGHPGGPIMIDQCTGEQLRKWLPSIYETEPQTETTE